LYFAGCVALLTRQVICQEFSRCYPDINICFWTDGSPLTQFEAQTACQQRSNSFLPRVTDGSVQSWLSAFRAAAGSLLGSNGFWIAVRSVSISSFHWIEGSPLAGLLFSVLECTCCEKRLLLLLLLLFFPDTQFPKNYAMQYKKYKNQAGMNFTPPPPSQNCHAVRWRIIIKMALLLLLLFIYYRLCAAE